MQWIDPLRSQEGSSTFSLIKAAHKPIITATKSTCPNSIPKLNENNVSGSSVEGRQTYFRAPANPSP